MIWRKERSLSDRTNQPPEIGNDQAGILSASSHMQGFDEPPSSVSESGTAGSTRVNYPSPAFSVNEPDTSEIHPLDPWVTSYLFEELKPSAIT